MVAIDAGKHDLRLLPGSRCRQTGGDGAGVAHELRTCTGPLAAEAHQVAGTMLVKRQPHGEACSARCREGAAFESAAGRGGKMREMMRSCSPVPYSRKRALRTRYSVVPSTPIST